MSAALVRLMLAVVFIFSVPVLYTIVFIVGWEMGGVSDEQALWATTIICGSYLVFGWIIIWMRAVRWTGWRLVLVLIAALASAGSGVLAGVSMAALIQWDEGFAILVGGMVWGITYLAATLLIWRETAAERVRRLQQLTIGAVACPSCGYNMTGLHEANCPECGSQYTLDQLFATATQQQKEVET